MASLQLALSASRLSPFRSASSRRATARRGAPQVMAAWGQLRSFGAPEEPDQKFVSLFSAPWIPASNNPATVYDARDALEVCSGLWGDERRECLSVFGLDARQVDTFYETVYTLEQALSHDTDPEEEAMHHGKER